MPFGWYFYTCRCSSVSYTKHPSTWLGWDIIDPMHLIASYWLPPWCLLALRFCLLLHFASTILFTSLAGQLLSLLSLICLLSIDPQEDWTDESVMHWICTDGDSTPIWLLAFGSWSSIMVGCTGLLGCIISLKHMTSHLSQSASPRAVLGGGTRLKHHQNDVPCQTNTSGLADGWAHNAMATDMVRSLMECS